MTQKPKSPPPREMSPSPLQDDTMVVVPVPDTLRRKALVMQGTAEEHMAAAVRRAQKAVEAMEPDFEAIFSKEVATLSQAHRAFLEGGRPEDRAALFRVAHDLRGSAASLGFPLAGRMAQSLSRLLSLVENPPAGLVAAHVEAIRAISREKVRDAADPVGAALAEELDLHAERTIDPGSEPDR